MKRTNYKKTSKMGRRNLLLLMMFVLMMSAVILLGGCGQDKDETASGEASTAVEGITSLEQLKKPDMIIGVPADTNEYEVVEKEFPEEELKTFFIPAGLLIAAFEEDSVFAWCDTEDGAYLLEGSGEGIGRETLLQTASEVIVTDADAAQEDAKDEA